MKRFAGIALAAVVALMLLTPADGASRMHFALSKSVPSKDTTVEPPSEVRLWFTEEPEEGTMSIRLIRAGEAVPTGDVTQDEEDPRVFFVTLEETATDGSHTVAWRAIGSDGHVVRGDFAFEVASR